ncbi:phenylalanine--tRNA ligase alpha subunit [Striga asiatica]|uniref:Phenylalanine--tRNA ligase alpha subunit n=1 Tax=Striga asiatica TaxID=4170 RepID=A0A5A7QKQ0_STRAF|nr:phenylalanine--tRNA ligase alpha subunit [Striga asiatica]
MSRSRERERRFVHSSVVRDKGSLLNRCTLSSKSKIKLRSNSKSKSKSSLLISCTISAKSKTKFKSKSKSKYSDSSKALANAELKLIKSANAQLKVLFLVTHSHHGTLDYPVISIDGNSFRVLDEDDDDLPRNLLPLLSPLDSKHLCPSWMLWLIGLIAISANSFQGTNGIFAPIRGKTYIALRKGSSLLFLARLRRMIPHAVLHNP